jgi:hypothetical protein
MLSGFLVIAAIVAAVQHIEDHQGDRRHRVPGPIFLRSTGTKDRAESDEQRYIR